MLRAQHRYSMGLRGRLPRHAMTFCIRQSRKLVSPPVIRIARLMDMPAPAGTDTVNVAGVTPIPPAISIAISAIYHATFTAWAMNASCV